MPTSDLAPKTLQSRLGGVMLRDRRQIEKNLDRARRLDPGDGREGALASVAAAIAASEAKVERRRASAPTPTYPPSLPLTERKDDVAAAIAAHQVVIVAGETGSGKSTQIPKICLELGRGLRGMVGHTQPRRLAARAVSERIAEELGVEVGGAVGYAVRFTDRVSDRTLVKLMTDGILLAELQRDRLLLAYDTIIVDEAHERSLNIDFILGYLKQLLPRRPDLKVVVTSATIDTERFAQHFTDSRGAPAPIVEVSGRAYPVELRYRPIVDPDDPDTEERDQTQAICDALAELGDEGEGDVLVFLSGEREIRDTAEAITALELPRTEVLPLFARLTSAEQHRVFQPHRGRRIVLATNVAETSLTVPGIRYVVDPGTARISRYNRRTKVQRLPIEAISQASANQRAGRCGRVAPGICVRLYTEEDYTNRPEFTEAEILRTNLASVILQMAAIGLGDVARFPFVDPPDNRNIKDGVLLLEELGALAPGDGDAGQRLTGLGRRLAQLPLDPRLGRMVLEAEGHGCLDEVMVITAALSIQDPRERPQEKQQQANEHHKRFFDDDSDFISYLKLWRYLQERQDELSSSQFRKLCKNEYLNWLRVREWQDIYGQLRQAVRTRKAADGQAANDAWHLETLPRDQIHRSLLAGLLSHVGLKSANTREYEGARGARFAITPGSALSKKSARWVMAAELVETNRLWGRVAARVQPEWAESLGDHLLKRTYSEPRWDGDKGMAVANERVTLYGLPLVTARPVPYHRVDAGGARQLFIRNALMDSDWAAHHHFLDHNRKLVEEVKALEDRARRRDLLVDEEALYRFFDERVPKEAVTGRFFDRWWKEERKQHPDRLNYTLDLLLDPAAGAISLDAYPDSWPVPEVDLVLPLTYEFEPGSPFDGVTAHVPLPLLDSLEQAPFDWQVPGLRDELATALIRCLPKVVRRNFVPAPDYARGFLAVGDPTSPEPLLDQLARELRRATGDPIPPGCWELERLPDHLRMTFSVEDEEGRPIATGKDLDVLRRRLRRLVEAEIATAARSYEHKGLTSWTIGTLPRQVEIPWAGFTVEAYPALVDEGDTVAVRALLRPEDQEHRMWAGTRRLLLLTAAPASKAVERQLPNDTKLALARSPYASPAELFSDCTSCAVDQILRDAGGPAWDEPGFERLRRAVDAGLTSATVYVVTVVGGILAAANSVELRLSRMVAPSLRAAVDDMSAQLERLVHPGFVSATGSRRLADVLRYLSAMERRLDRLVEAPGRDRELMLRAQRLEDEYERALVPFPRGDLPPEAEQVHWMLEELRVSFWAQSLGTAQPVSEQRILREIHRLTPD